MKGKFVGKFTHFIIAFLLFLGTFLIYKSIYPEPRNWYDHYVHLTKSILISRVDTPYLPEFYQDKIVIGNKTYLPFPPGASLALIPFVLLINNITQQQISIIIGAINIALFYILLSKFTNKKSAILLSLFVGFGTSFFWASVVGTTWFFAHVVAVGFLLISLIFHLKNKNFLSGIFFALSSLTRFPILVSGMFFVYLLKKQKKQLLLFLLGVSLFIPVILFYNYARFGSIWEGGYLQVYQGYVNGGIAYSLQRIWHPNSTHFNYFDIRSIPYHLYTFFVMPPEGHKPNPYGMGVLFTSPLLLMAFLPPYSKRLVKASFLGIIPTSLLVFSHYAQGWVQFGYRFVLDFLIYLMIILAIKFKPTKLNLALLVISIVVNFWGVRWAIQLGW